MGRELFLTVRIAQELSQSFGVINGFSFAGHVQAYTGQSDSGNALNLFFALTED